MTFSITPPFFAASKAVSCIVGLGGSTYSAYRYLQDEKHQQQEEYLDYSLYTIASISMGLLLVSVIQGVCITVRNCKTRDSGAITFELNNPDTELKNLSQANQV